jgi:hypothetical protein
MLESLYRQYFIILASSLTECYSYFSHTCTDAAYDPGYEGMAIEKKKKMEETPFQQ